MIVGCAFLSAAAFNDVEPEPEIVYVTQRVVEYVPKIEFVDRIVYVPIEVEKIVEVEKVVEVEKIVEKEVIKYANAIDYTMDDMFCLAAVIYQEAGGNACSDECRIDVADVVLNRKNDSRFPNTIREVLEAKNQYGMFWKTGVEFVQRGNTEEENQAIARAWYIAAKVLNGEHGELYGNGYVWQAEFIQGTDVIEVCGTYFGR